MISVAGLCPIPLVSAAGIEPATGGLRDSSRVVVRLRPGVSADVRSISVSRSYASAPPSADVRRKPPLFARVVVKAVVKDARR